MEITLFILGLLFSIPMAVLANLIQPRVEQQIALRTAQKSHVRAARLNKEAMVIQDFHAHRHLLSEYLLAQVIRATLYGSLAGILAGILYATQSTMRATYISEYFVEYVMSAIPILGQIISIIAALLIVNVCSRALGTLAKVQNYEEYRDNIETQVKSLHSKEEQG